jgi:hypothetical protein
MFDRAVEVLTGAGAELELARTLTAYAEFEERSGRDETASELRRQASLIAEQMRTARGRSDNSNRDHGRVPGPPR